MDTAEEVLLAIGAREWGMEEYAIQALDEAPSYARPGENLVIVAWEVFLELLEIYEETERAFNNAINRAKIVNYLAKRLPNRQDAEDLSQEIFLSIWNSLGTFRPYKTNSWQAWQYMIAKRKLNSRLKQMYNEEPVLNYTDCDVVIYGADQTKSNTVRVVCERWIQRGGKPASFAAEVLAIVNNEREYVGLTGKKMASAVGVSTYTLWKWTGEITEEILSENI